ncbi:MAG TPA: bifunctional UDP-N-acetylglucosamine diphosphorylase/glucosamine-1-phosphate N-acetyltransferase GlmU [Stellaceae bacterium]|nr:bifunctional UDP-N-acetylglucosamine diphosphorylase/glucosamine-1-phosphate N-acetyltransferase GlmU [Stellaceae bacterium]
MTEPRFVAIVLAAGSGTRMQSSTPKVLHRVAGRPMILHLIDSLRRLEPAATVAVLGAGMGEVARLVAPAECAVQEPPRGTGDAVAAARGALARRLAPQGPIEDVLILFGDTPLLQPETMRRLLEGRRRPPAAAIAAAAMRPADPGPYGRLVCGPDGALERIVEARDASPEEREIGLCNGGLMAVAARHLFALVEALGSDNAKREFYLTDIVGLAREQGLLCRAVELPAEELVGVNNRAELAAAEAAMQDRLRRRAMDEGASLVAPHTVFLSFDTRLARDVVVEPNVVFGPGVSVGEGALLRSFSYFEGAEIGAHAIVGPFARLRPGAVLERDVHVGNFVEVKAARLGIGVKANHLSYLGDAEVGAGSNIGAGTITCNYDGFEKHRTVIGDNVFIGSNTALVAPVTVGAGAYVAAGSTITEDVSAEALAIARGRQVEKRGRAAEIRARRGGKG